ncbi:prepilin-type N-terminal cleavage/methylation domain-containing protein [Caloramator sp. mosi_1]|uniref:type II secretion system protein n=1 Tax=Caloramator sp. mosi_1 TaxID=3023090 RepID=UPI0023618A35|nr:prepilin-type N-terminal cleavage/methylation domain-containing protein [Caloramator sp. mosi_1]WDC83775.1 prepilin-type N-terminal cleavage/methylation domain-containing protein [Caloramator sp. mosi_1]
MIKIKKKGFTLIEVLAVLFSIALLIPVIADINTNNVMLQRKSKDNYNMYLIAMSLCEMYKKNSEFYKDVNYTIF